MHVYHSSGAGGRGQLAEYLGALADVHQGESVPRPRGKALRIAFFTMGNGNLMRDSRYRDRKAPRLAARRVSRKAREAAKWSDAVWGVGA